MIDQEELFSSKKRKYGAKPIFTHTKDGTKYTTKDIEKITGLSHFGSYSRLLKHQNGLLSDEKLLSTKKLGISRGVPFEEFFVMVDGEKVFASVVAKVTGCAKELARERLRKYKDGAGSKKSIWKINDVDDNSGDIEFSEDLERYLKAPLNERLASDAARESKLNDIPELTECERRYL